MRPAGRLQQYRVTHTGCDKTQIALGSPEDERDSSALLNTPPSYAETYWSPFTQLLDCFTVCFY